MQPLRAFLKRLFLSPDEPRLRSGWRLLCHAILIESVAIIVFLLYDWAIHPGPQEVIIEFSNIVALQLIVITLATWIARRYLDRRTFRSLGFGWDTQSFYDLAVGFILPALVIGAIFAFEWGAGWLQIDSVMWKEEPSTTYTIITNALLTSIAVGFYEELLFRGYRLQNLIEGLNLTWALVLSSAIFALAHLPNPHSSLASTLGLFGAGLFMAYAWLRTGRLWLPIGLHIGWNFFEGAVFGFPVSGLNFPGIVQQIDIGPVVITGGAFGPEAGLVMLPMLAIGGVLIWAYTGGKCAQRSWNQPTKG